MKSTDLKSGMIFILALLSFFQVKMTNAATLVYSNDVMGELEPCGCKADPLGGMVRRAGLLKTIQDPNLLQLDAGNLFFANEIIAPALKEQAEIQAHFVVRALNLMKHSAMTPGPKDFALGLKVFNQLRKEAHFPILAANLNLAGGKPFLEPYKIFKLSSGGKPLRVAVLGLVSALLPWPTPEVQVAPPIQTAQNLVPKLRNKADLVIVLSHQGLEADTALAQTVPGIDIIVGANSLSFLNEPKIEGKTFIFQSSYRNQYVGVVPLTLPFIASEHKLVALDPVFEARGPVQKLIEEFKARLTLISERELKSFHQAEAKLAGSSFHTFPKCASCHMKQFDFWRKTAHFRAIEPLLEKNQFANKECLGCHSVGLGRKGGFSNWKDVAFDSEGRTIDIHSLATYLKTMSESKTLDDPESFPLRQQVDKLKKAYAPVQCENCHSPGAGHPFEGTYSKAVQSQACLKCHTQDRAPNWYKPKGKLNLDLVAEKRRSVTCPAD